MNLSGFQRCNGESGFFQRAIKETVDAALQIHVGRPPFVKNGGLNVTCEALHLQSNRDLLNDFVHDLNDLNCSCLKAWVCNLEVVRAREQVTKRKSSHVVCVCVPDPL